jgi:hypothetical protein
MGSRPRARSRDPCPLRKRRGRNRVVRFPRLPDTCGVGSVILV